MTTKQIFEEAHTYKSKGWRTCDAMCMHGGVCKLVDDNKLIDVFSSYEENYLCICRDGFMGDRCQTTMVDFAKRDKETSSSSAGKVTGIVVGGFALVALMVIAVIVWRRRRFINREKRRNKHICKRTQSRAIIEGFSVVDEKPRQLKSVASINSSSCTSISSSVTHQQSNSVDHNIGNMTSRNPYGKIEYRIQAPHMKRNRSTGSIQNMARNTSHSKIDAIQKAENNNNRNSSPVISKMADRETPLPTVEEI